jgi:glycosyltransferase involved in cell wall biosynthesis
MEALTTALNLRDRVHFLGEQPHATIGDWYAAADIFTLPSPAETQGLVLVEAMTKGLPCVVVEEGGAREVVVPNETGLLVPFAPEPFAQTINTLLCDTTLRRQMGANGREHAAAYTPEAMARSILALYEKALRLPHRPVESGVQKITTQFKRRRNALRRAGRRASKK